MTILTFDTKSLVALTAATDAPLVQTIKDPKRKISQEEVKLTKELPPIKKTQSKGNDTPNKPKPNSKLEKLYQFIKGSGGEVFCPDGSTLIARTNVRGISIHAKENALGNIDVEVKNFKGETLSSKQGVNTPEQFRGFMMQEGLDISKVAKPTKEVIKELYTKSMDHFKTPPRFLR